eukprot:1979471-Prymnesium_polylepis.1
MSDGEYATPASSGSSSSLARTRARRLRGRPGPCAALGGDGWGGFGVAARLPAAIARGGPGV